MLEALPHSLVNYTEDGGTSLLAFYFDRYGNPKFNNLYFNTEEEGFIDAVGTFKGGLLTSLSISPNPIRIVAGKIIDYNGISYVYNDETEVSDEYLGASAVNAGYGPSPSIEELIVGDFKAGSPVVGTNVDLPDLAGANVFAFVSFDDDGGNTAVLLAKNNSTGLKAVIDGESVVGMTERLGTDYESLLNDDLEISINGYGYTIPADHWRIEIVADPETIVPFLKDFVA